MRNLRIAYRAITSATLIVLGLTGCTPFPKFEPTGDPKLWSVEQKQGFIDLFVELALGTEKLDPDWEDQPRFITKWDGPVTVGYYVIEDAETNPNLQRIEGALAVFTELARNFGVSIQVSKSTLSDINIWFYSKPQHFKEIRDEIADLFSSKNIELLLDGMDILSKYADIERGEGCFFYTTFVLDGEHVGRIANATVLLPTYSEDTLFHSCFYEEMAQALGLRNDVDERVYGFDTLFDDRLDGSTLTEADRLLLETLYDPRIKPGMNEVDVRKVLGEILDLPQNLIN